MSTFADFGLKSTILDALKDLGFETPTPIQDATLDIISKTNTDIIALAQTGTGKTAAFSLPILNRIDTNVEEVQAFILSPTRELANQITKDIQNFSKYMKGLKVLPVYGGASIRDQIQGLRDKPQIVVGTPGRVLDLINKNKLKVNDIKFLVLDEADEMLSMGFKDDLDAILSSTPEDRQTLLFSATMPDGVAHIAKNYMKKPETISMGKVNTSNVNIEHQYFVVDQRDRYTALKMLVDSNPDIYGIVFCRTKIDTQEVADMLGRDGYNSDALHGDLVQSQRDFVMSKFKSGQLQLLIATDVAARGLDVSDLTHVINYSLPDDQEVYIHRTGRTGRAGKKGIALSILTKKEVFKIKQIERQINLPVTYTKVPDGDTICNAQLMSLIDKVKNTPVDEETIAPFVQAIEQGFEGMDSIDIIKKFISTEFNRFIEYYQGVGDVNANFDNNSRGSRLKDHQGTMSKSEMATLVLNHGRKSNMDPRSLLNFINNLTPNKKVNVGHISIDADQTTFEVKHEQVDLLINGLKDSSYKGVTLTFRAGTKALSKKGGGHSYSGGDIKPGGSYGRSNDRSKPHRKGGSQKPASGTVKKKW